MIEKAKEFFPGNIRRFAKIIISNLDLKFYLKLNVIEPIIVLQFGKVGSFSCYRSLIKQYDGVVLHAHFLRDSHDARIRFLHREILNREKKVKIISLTREPIGRGVSAFFQNYDHFMGNMAFNTSPTINELKEIFLNSFYHDMVENWHDKNIKSDFGIDVYAEPFPNCGYNTYISSNCELLLMQSEINDSIKEKLIAEFISYPNFKLKRHNESKSKPYSLLYNKFINEVKFPKKYLDTICNFRYTKHFYTEEFMNKTRKKWE